MNPPIVRLFALLRRCCSACWSASRRAGRCSSAEALRDNPHNRRALLRGAADQARHDPRRRRRGAGRAARRSPSERYDAPLPDRATLFAHAGRLLVHDARPLRARAVLQRPADRAAGPSSIGAVDSLLDKRSESATTCARRSTRRRSRSAIDGARRAARARSWRSSQDRRGAGDGLEPGYDPNDLDRRPFERLATTTRTRRSSTARRRAGYPPGSTFKVVTATAALDTGKYTAGLDASAARTARRSPASPLNNFGGEDFGDITLTDALTNSVNTVWAEVGEKLGKQHDGRVHGALRLLRASRRSTTPTSRWSPSGACRKRQAAAADARAAVDVGRMAIGQGKLLVTPLQMATVAPDDRQRRRADGAALVQKIVDPDGRTHRRDRARGGRARDVRRDRARS